MKPPLLHTKRKKNKHAKIFMKKDLSLSPKTQADITSFLKQVLEVGGNNSSSASHIYEETSTHHVWIPKEEEENENQTTNSMDNQNCVDEIKAFVKGGLPGLARLSEVYPSICIHFKILSDLEYYQVMYQSGTPFEIWKDWLPPSKWSFSTQSTCVQSV